MKRKYYKKTQLNCDDIDRGIHWADRYNINSLQRFYDSNVKNKVWDYANSQMLAIEIREALGLE